MTTRWIVFFCLFGFVVQHVLPQDVLPQDTTTTKQVSDKRDTPYHFKPVQFVVPTAMIGVGLLGLNKGWLEDQNHKLRDALQKNSPHHIKLDDYSQYAPLVALYGLDLVGVRGKHHIIDKTILTGTAYALMSASVNLLKWTTNERRPDGSARNSFPSGHTATAFVGAELLRREYWEVSPWIGVTGYAVATTTGGSAPVQQPPLADRCHRGCGHRHIERGGCLLVVPLLGQMAIPQTLQIQHLPVAVCRPHGKRHGHADFVLRYTLYVFQKNITTFY